MQYTRAHFIANGVDFEQGSLREVLLFKYFEKQRMIRFKETMLLVASNLNSEEMLRRCIREYQNELFPESVKETESFESKGKRTLKHLQGKAFVLSHMGGDYTELMAMDSAVTDMNDVEAFTEGFLKDRAKLDTISEAYHSEEMNKVLSEYKEKFGRYPRGYEDWDNRKK